MNETWRRRNRAPDAYELYERQHMPRNLLRKSISNDIDDQQVRNPDENEADNIDARAEKFIKMEHQKFSLGRWVSDKFCLKRSVFVSA
ncbi:hypothetical protein M569_14183 [Genlisea aurea]|uniref:Uncharacterized protein n=1 Tax=Genlisea aurea TaxID=192259 RepID=S8C1P7_9LAMI|nr:hypothetical protein M569_14183 [Genlisea aurea]